MRKTINRVNLQGRLYDHSLELKVTGEQSKAPGTQYIAGNVDIATDDAMQNIVTVHFSYTTAKTSTGKDNATFSTLMNIINGIIPSAMKEGADRAGFVRCDTSIALNEFYTDRNGKEEFVSVKRNEGGFLHKADSIDKDENARNTFETDIVITNVRHVDADEERGFDEKAVIKGAIFDFRGAMLPVEFDALSPAAINYFEGLDVSPSNPIFTKVKGRQISQTNIRTIVEEGAFCNSVREVPSTRKSYEVTWAMNEPYEWDVEGSLTAKELTDKMAQREVALAEIKARNDEYKKSRANAGGTNFAASPSIAPVSNNSFNF